MRERRIPDHIVAGEQHERAELLSNTVASWLLDEEPVEPLGRDVGRVGQGVEPFASRDKRVRVDVGCKNEGFRRVGFSPCVLCEQHCDRIRFFAGGAARDPHPDLIVGPLSCRERRNQPLECLERRPIAKEVRDADQQILEQRLRLVGLRVQETRILANRIDPVHPHPMRETTSGRRRFVAGKIVARSGSNVREDLGDGDFVQRIAGSGLRHDGRGSAPGVVGGQPRGHLRDGEDVVGEPRRNRVPGHVLVIGFVRILYEADTAPFLHPLHPHGSVGAGAREDDAGGSGALTICERSEEDVDRSSPLLDPRDGGQLEMAVDHRHAPIRRDHVNMIRNHRGSIDDSRHRDRRGALQHFGQPALVLRRQVQDDDVGHPAVDRDVLEERSERFDSTGGGAQANYQKVVGCHSITRRAPLATASPVT